MKNNFIPIIRDIWSQTAMSEKIVVIKWFVNIQFSLPSSSKQQVEAKEANMTLESGQFIIVNSEHLTG
jgi:hypothetical protein